MRVLIVEDEVYARQSLVKHVRENTGKEASLEILEASNGKDGLQIFRDKSPEIAILDIKMPFLDGLSLLKIIMEEQPLAKVMMVSGYAYFQYSQEALNCGAAGYLLKPIQDKEFRLLYQKMLDEKDEQEKSRETLRILKGDDAVSRDIYRHMTADGPLEKTITDEVFDSMFDCFFCAIFFFPGEQFPDMVSIVHELEKTLHNDSPAAFKTIIVSKQCLGVILRRHNRVEWLMDACVAALFEKKLLCKAGVSQAHHGSGSIGYSYRQAMTAVKSNIFFKKRLLFFDELRAVGGAEADMPSEGDFDILRRLLERGDTENAASSASQMLTRLIGNKSCTATELERLLQRLTELLQKPGKAAKQEKTSESAEERYIFDLLLYQTPQELILAVTRAVEKRCNYSHFNSEEDYEDIMATVSRYIHENYNKEISLRYLAENVLYLNHTYLSHLIREKTGKSYSTYLREVRIEKANELLLNSSLTITDVASMCGYNDASQFIRIFKKEIGLTPKKVRDTNALSKSEKEE